LKVRYRLNRGDRLDLRANIGLASLWLWKRFGFSWDEWVRRVSRWT
jgi:hypothetical protein